GHEIAGKGTRGIAVELTRELVEQDDLGQPPLRGRAPWPELGARRPRVGLAEARGAFGVKGFAAAEPVLRAVFLEPEAQHVLGCHFILLAITTLESSC